VARADEALFSEPALTAVAFGQRHVWPRALKSNSRRSLFSLLSPLRPTAIWIRFASSPKARKPAEITSRNAAALPSYFSYFADGFGHGGIGVIGIILIVLVVLLLMGRL